MDNTTNIIYNIKAIDNATATINAVYASLSALRKQRNITIRIKTIYDTKNNITNTVKDVYKASATVSATVKRTLVDTYKTVETHQTNIINKNKTINDTLNKTKNVAKDVANQAGKTNSHFSKWTKNIGKFISKFLNIRRIMDYIGQVTKASADWIENLHLLEVAYKGAGDEAIAFGKKLADAYRTSYNETFKYLSLFRQMTSAIGIADDTATKLSETLTAIGYDISSLYNISVNSAMEKLEAGIAGQTKPLRTLGMDITAQSLDSYLKNTMKLGNITSKQMTQADKMILRTIVIMEQAQNTYGDMAVTINTFANQVKVLKGSIDNFKLAVGDFLTEYAQPAVSFLAGMVIAITDIIRAFVPLKEQTDEVDKLTNSLMGVDDELNEIAKTTGLLSFDKFNALTKSGDGSSFSNITSILEEAFNEKYVQYMQTLQDKMGEIKNKAEEIARAIINWVFPFAEWDEETGKLTSNLGEVNWILKAIWETIKIIVSIGIARKLMKLPEVITKINSALVAANASSQALKATWASFAAIGFVYLLIDILTKWKELDTWGKVWRITLLAVCAAVFLLNTELGKSIVQMVILSAKTIKTLITSLGALLAKIVEVAAAMWQKFISSLAVAGSTMAGMAIGLSALAVGFASYMMNLDKMSKEAKIAIPIFAALSAVFVGLAVAKAAAAAGIAAPVMAGITAAALTAGIVLAAGTAMAVGKYEQGGLPPKGQIFIANENGNPELVGNIGGNTAVANNDMIVTAIENAAFRGYVRAIDTVNEGSPSSTHKDIVLVVSGKELARATAVDMADEFGRRNIKIK